MPKRTPAPGQTDQDDLELRQDTESNLSENPEPVQIIDHYVLRVGQTTYVDARLVKEFKKLWAEIESLRAKLEMVERTARQPVQERLI